jgi:ParB/Sulfiredoxin domain
MSDENQHPDPYPHAGGEPEANPAATPSADMADTAHQANRERDRTTVAIDLIEFGHRIRALDHDQVMALKESIALSGLINPLLVYRRSITRDGQAVDGFGLIAGAHRLAAFQALGRTEIDVTVADMNEPQRIIAECDENLCGTRLTQAERADFTRIRKEAYEKLHPETRHGANQHTRSGQVVHSSFATATGAATGQNARTVRRDAERGEKISKSAIEMIKRTKLDTGAYLDELKGLSSDEQEQKVQADLASLESRGPKSISRALRGADPEAKKSKTTNHATRSLPADRPSLFFLLLEELAGFREEEFRNWRTMYGVSRDAIEKALIYAQSAASRIQRFQEINAEPQT